MHLDFTLLQASFKMVGKFQINMSLCRITSYNVCYTKLLREGPSEEHPFGLWEPVKGLFDIQDAEAAWNFV